MRRSDAVLKVSVRYNILGAIGGLAGLFILLGWAYVKEAQVLYESWFGKAVLVYPLSSALPCLAVFAFMLGCVCFVQGHLKSAREKSGVRRPYKLAIRKLLDKRAVSLVVSAVIMTGAAIALGLAVLAWSQSRSSEYARVYGEATDVEMARLKERLTVEHIHYNTASGDITVYLFNCGTMDSVKIKSVHVGTGELHQSFLSPSLYSFNGTTLIPDQVLDKGEEGCVILHCPLEGGAKQYYYVRVVTERGSLYDSGFVY